MKSLKIVGIVLLALGIIMLAMGEFSFKKKKKVVDTDVIDITTTETENVNLPPVIGAVVAVSGLVILLLGRKRG